MHPCAAVVPGTAQKHGLDELVEGLEPEEANAKLAEAILALGRRAEGVTYAVPGSPFMGEPGVALILTAAEKEGLPVRVIDGLSGAAAALRALRIDLTPTISVVEAAHVAGLLVPNFPPSQPALITGLGSREQATELKLTLMANYPDDYPVSMVFAAGTAVEKASQVALWQIDQNPNVDEATCLYLPARETGRAFEDFQQVIARLRAPDGCPWDREQTHLSLRPYLLEEAYEVLEALDQEDMTHLQEELGDLLLQIVLHTQIATEDEDFNMTDVLQGISSKLIRRHPHVFAETQVGSVDGVIQNWEKIKADERKHNGKEQPKGMLDGIPLALPALTQADQIQKRAKRVGFDWHEIAPVIEKIKEELGELQEAETEEDRRAEAGDLLFASVNLIRWLGIDPELALRECNLRFRRRFGYIERAAAEQGKTLQEMSFEEMDALWEQAKDAVEPHEGTAGA